MIDNLDHETIVSQQLREALYHLRRAEKTKRNEAVVKIYKNIVAPRRPGLSGFITDLFRGRIIMPGREDSIANELIARLREYGYNAIKVTNRKTAIVKLTVTLRHAAHSSA